MSENVKIYEEKKKGLPIWAWLLPLLLLLALLAYFLLHKPATIAATPAPAPVAAATTFPDLGTVHFDTDKADLSDADKATLDRAAVAMKNDPGVHMRLEGFTDSTGTDPHNLTLSQRRAISVGEYLKGKGIETNRLTGEGFGPNNPVDTNATSAGKADNRRVELFSQK